MNMVKNNYKNLSTRPVIIIIALIIIWPLGLYWMWRRKAWTPKIRTAVTTALSVLVMLFSIAVYNAPPTIALNDASMAHGLRTDDSSIDLAGKVSTFHISSLTINGQPVDINDPGDFSYKLMLEEGDNTISIVAVSEKGTDIETFVIHRTTAAEFAERQRIAEEKAAEEKRLEQEQAEKEKQAAEEARAAAIAAMPTCDGKIVQKDCKLSGKYYSIYIYHPAVPAQTHKETTTTYREVVVGYCTLCVDGTYSPSCATGSGACSWHGGVAQWNAPRYAEVPIESTKTVIDEPAKAAYYEKELNLVFN